jgi:hypothetical protein
VFTCSHSLDLLLDKYRSYVIGFENLESRINHLEKENFDLKKELIEKQAVTSYLQEQTKF